MRPTLIGETIPGRNPTVPPCKAFDIMKECFSFALIFMAINCVLRAAANEMSTQTEHAARRENASANLILEYKEEQKIGIKLALN